MKFAEGILLLLIAALTGAFMAYQNGEAVVADPTIRHVWFLDGTNWPESDEWTNLWTVTALTATNLDVPLTQWLAAPAVLECYQGHLAMAVASAGPILFCRARFEPKGEQ